MGNCVFNNKSTSSDLDFLEEQLSKNTFEKVCIVGKGGFGRVWKVQSKKIKTHCYALKEMAKSRIIAKKSIQSVLVERNLLSELNNPFIINMRGAFQDRENLYLVLDYAPGGDFRYHLPYKYFNEKETRFIVACVIEALEYLHGQNVVHRDIKPENLVFEENGYVRLTDFGISKRLPEPKEGENPNEHGLIVEASGTPGYMAPEAMCRLPHGPISDLFAVGVMVHEMMFRRRPYSGANKQEIRDKMVAKQVQIKAFEIPNGWSIEAADFTNKLIRRKPSNRLGFNKGIAELKAHPWFKGFDWEALKNKTMPAPWSPPAGDNYQGKNFEFKGEDQRALEEGEKLIRRDTVQRLFDGYYFDDRRMGRFASSTITDAGVSSRHGGALSAVKARQPMKKSRNVAVKGNKIAALGSKGSGDGVISKDMSYFSSNASTGLGSFKCSARSPKVSPRRIGSPVQH